MPTQLPRGSPKRPTRRDTLALLVTLAVAAPWGADAHADDKKPPSFRVIVHPDNRIDAASRAFLADAFLKRVTRWGDDEAIRPVDQRPDSGVRERFSRDVLKRSVAAVRNYWQQRIFSGRGVPPPELESDEAVVTYVLQHRGAVGYVSGGADLRGARAIRLE